MLSLAKEVPNEHGRISMAGRNTGNGVVGSRARLAARAIPQGGFYETMLRGGARPACRSVQAMGIQTQRASVCASLGQPWLEESYIRHRQTHRLAHPVRHSRLVLAKPFVGPIGH